MKIVKNELKRAFRNPQFFLSLLISCTLVFFYFLYFLHTRTGVNERILAGASFPNDYFEVSYTAWIGGPQTSFWQKIFFWILPFLATLPYAGSYFEDVRSGYLKNILVRTDRKTYLLSKYAATFLSSASATAIPLAFSFLLSALVYPSHTPEASALFTNIFTSSRWSALIFSAPLLHLFVSILFASVFTGFLCCLALPITLPSSKKYLCYLFPFFSYLISSLLAQLLVFPAGDVAIVYASVETQSTLLTRICMLLLPFLFSFVPFFTRGMKQHDLTLSQ